MILMDNFYTLQHLHMAETGQSLEASLLFNPSHAIFSGHFPGQPVVPGVCMLQVVKELLEQATAKKLQLLRGQDLKFLSVIDPRSNSLVQASLQYTPDAAGHFTVSARLFYDDTTCFKFNGLFKTC